MILRFSGTEQSSSFDPVQRWPSKTTLSLVSLPPLGPTWLRKSTECTGAIRGSESYKPALPTHLRRPPPALLRAPGKLKVQLGAPPPGDPWILTPAVTWRRKRCAALSMLSRAAFCFCRARAAAPRAVWRPDQRRATAAAMKQQARAAPRAPESAAHSSPSTIISHLAELPRAAEISTGGLRRKTRPGSAGDPRTLRGRPPRRAARPRARSGARRCQAEGPRPAARNCQGLVWLRGSSRRPCALGQAQLGEREGHPLPVGVLRSTGVAVRPGPALVTAPRTPEPQLLRDAEQPAEHLREQRQTGLADLRSPQQFSGTCPGEACGGPPPQDAHLPPARGFRGGGSPGTRTGSSSGAPTCCPLLFLQPGDPVSVAPGSSSWPNRPFLVFLLKHPAD